MTIWTNCKYWLFFVIFNRHSNLFAPVNLSDNAAFVRFVPVHCSRSQSRSHGRIVPSELYLKYVISRGPAEKKATFVEAKWIANRVSWFCWKIYGRARASCSSAHHDFKCVHALCVGTFDIYLCNDGCELPHFMPGKSTVFGAFSYSVSHSIPSRSLRNGISQFTARNKFACTFGVARAASQTIVRAHVSAI